MQNPELLDDAPRRVIYSELLNPEAIKGLSVQVVPDPGEVLGEPASIEVLTELGATGSGTLDTLSYLIAHPGTSVAALTMIRSPAWMSVRRHS
jgi:hypothetical protein